MKKLIKYKKASNYLLFIGLVIVFIHGAIDKKLKREINYIILVVSSIIFLLYLICIILYYYERKKIKKDHEKTYN